MSPETNRVLQNWTAEKEESHGGALSEESLTLSCPPPR